MSEVRLTPIRRGDPRTVTVSVVDTNGDPVDLSSSTWSSKMGRTASSSLQTTLTVDSSQAHAGVLAIHMSGDQTRGLGLTLVGDLEGSVFGTILTFTAFVLSDVTRGSEEPSGGIIDNVTLTWGGVGGTLSSAVAAILLPVVPSTTMSSLVYDPRGIEADAFDASNLTGVIDGGVFT